MESRTIRIGPPELPGGAARRGMDRDQRPRLPRVLKARHRAMTGCRSISRPSRGVQGTRPRRASSGPMDAERGPGSRLLEIVRVGAARRSCAGVDDSDDSSTIPSPSTTQPLC
jgi:hypothetical protein